jgi:hypothetical protein
VAGNQGLPGRDESALRRVLELAGEPFRWSGRGQEVTMKISLRLDQLDSHAHFALFTNGGKAGDLCMTREEWNEFRTLLESGTRMHGHSYVLNDNRPTLREESGK